METLKQKLHIVWSNQQYSYLHKNKHSKTPHKLKCDLLIHQCPAFSAHLKTWHIQRDKLWFDGHSVSALIWSSPVFLPSDSLIFCRFVALTSLLQHSRPLLSITELSLCFRGRTEQVSVISLSQAFRGRKKKNAAVISQCGNCSRFISFFFRKTSVVNCHYNPAAALKLSWPICVERVLTGLTDTNWRSRGDKITAESSEFQLNWRMALYTFSGCWNI